jgi:mono/diheme cytochrome c family protein
VDYDEMAGLIGYLWSLEPQGDARRGQAEFTKMGCAACHSDSAKDGPVLNEKDLSPVSLISAVSTHGPAMRAAMKKKSLTWPRIGRAEIADIAAYLKSRQPAAPKQVAAR